MPEKTKNFAFHYTVLFSLTWLCLYLIFPAWISLHTIFQGRDFLDLNNPVARSLVILGFIIYFIISAFIINRYFNALTVDKPVIIKITDWFNYIKNNLWLTIFCCLAVIFHIHSFYLVDVAFLRQGLWMYDFSDSLWHRLFNFPIQYSFWSFVILLLLLIKQKRMINFVSNFISSISSAYKSNNFVKLAFILIMFGLFYVYSYLFPYSMEDSLQLLRFPPVSHYLYLVTYYAFGISHIAPRILQFIFYIFSAVYLYRTILLFREKETALLGATIYLFSPVIFFYASLTFLESGTTFFMILISFYFLKFIKEKDNRDLILTTYFIGIGFMYSRIVLVVLIVCFAYLIFSRIKNRDWHSFIHFKILLLSLITVLPFFMIGVRDGLNFYGPALSNMLSFDYLYMVIQSQLSFILSFMLLFSIILIFFTKKDDLSLYYGLYFIAYYVFLTLKLHIAIQRYSLALYPAIAVLLAQSIFSIIQRVKWKHIYKLVLTVLTIYLIFLCLVPRSGTNLITFKYEAFETQYFPIDKAVDWISNMTNNDDKVLSLFTPWNFQFYIERIYSDKGRLNQSRFIYYYPVMDNKLIYPIENLKRFCDSEKISYIMFPYGPKIEPHSMGASKDIKYLEENINDGFIEVKKFSHEDNYILIYKVNEK